MTPSSRSRLPSLVSSFVGRSSELDELAVLATQPGLVTLLGAPGVGKSRLALEVARATSADTDVWWVELASLAPDGPVVEAVAATLGIHEQPERPLVETVLSYLRAGPALVVLDNCEHVVGACRAFVDSVLASCAEVRVLATSREPLGADGERRWAVPPLEPMDSEELFYTRAGASQASFAVDDESAAAISKICARLDGIPLAIELAAGRVAVLSAAEIAERLDDDPFAVLGGGNRDGAGRHETLRAALDWSYEVLSEPERGLLRQLSVFRGGFTLAAVRRVCDNPRALSSLVAKSLVVKRRTDRRVRYSLLDTIGRYAADRLDEDAGATTDLAARHGAWCVEVAETVEPELTGSDQLTALALIDIEHANLAAGFEWALTNAPEHAVRIAAALTVWWRVRGRYSEGRRWIGTALNGAPDAPPLLRAKAMWGAGWLAHMLGDDRAAHAALEQSVDLAGHVGDNQTQGRALLVLTDVPAANAPDVLSQLDEAAQLARHAGDRWCEAQALASAGHVRMLIGQPDDAKTTLQRALTVARNANDYQSLLSVLKRLADVTCRQADLAEAETHTRGALEAARALGDRDGSAAATLELGDITFWRGDAERAHSLLAESVALRRPLGLTGDTALALIGLGYMSFALNRLVEAHDQLNEALALEKSLLHQSIALRGLGLVALARGDTGQAQRSLDEALAAAVFVGSSHAAAATLTALALVAEHVGDVERALALRKRSLRVWWDVQDIRGVVDSLGSLASALIQTDQHRPGARLLAAAESVQDAHGYTTPAKRLQSESCFDRLRGKLSSGDLEQLRAEGAQMSLDDAVRSAVKTHDRRRRPLHGWLSLTGTEQEIVRLVSIGCSNRDIALRLAISDGNVKNHLLSIFRKLGVSSRSALTQELPSGTDNR